MIILLSYGNDWLCIEFDYNEIIIDSHNQLVRNVYLNHTEPSP